LMEASRVAIRRHVKRQSNAHPYDPEWELYLEERLDRQLEGTLAGKGRIEFLWKGQGGRCGRCGPALRPSEKPWHIHHKRWRCQGGTDTVDNVELLHDQCHRQIHYGKESGRYRPRLAKGGPECPSRRKREFHVRFRGGGKVAIPSRYPAT
jgi:RNA-directed DNA polymerase